MFFSDSFLYNNEDLDTFNFTNLIYSHTSTLHLTKAVEYQKRIGSFIEELLHHMPPLGWEHINLLGEYQFEENGLYRFFKITKTFLTLLKTGESS
ncbi:hypothetical protein J6TS2_21550 [Heyndrickxia sporothermodurans]|nr:hypothetical protein J6TS2_21550 [Heyndrickxia sporothermodurans]